MRHTIVSTIAPASFAGLVAGPFAALLSGAPLHLHGPFHSAEFLAELDAAAPVHLVAPRAMAADLDVAGLLTPRTLASLMLLDRSGETDPPPAPVLRPDLSIPVIDLCAFGERALVAEPRAADGSALPPAWEPHMISAGDRSIVAVQRRTGAGTFAFEGAAVSVRI
jgi:hypothetical protein